MRVAFYLRTSTNERTTENQRRELQAVATRLGWTVVAEYEDAGISGSKGRSMRPGLDSALKAAVRGEYDTLAAWSVDRLGRSLQDLLATLNELHAARRGLYLHRQALDTATPAGRALFGMLGVFAEFERAIITERVRAGIARARAQGRRLGPPVTITRAQQRTALAVLSDGGTLRAAASAGRMSIASVRRLKAS